MSADRPSSGRDPEIDAEVEVALRAVDRPPARPEFREELRRRFLAPAESLPESTRAVSSGSDGVSARRRQRRLTGALLAAGLLLAAGYFMLHSRAPKWRVLEIAPGSVVKADGVSLPVNDLAALAFGLQKATEIEVESGDLILQVGDLSLFDLDKDTRVAFQGFDSADHDAPIQVRASSGRLRARTGPDFRGRTMRIQTDLMDVLVTGTAFAIDYEPHGTCVCCLHGDVQIWSKALGPDPRTIPPNQMCLIYRAEHEPKLKSGAHPDHHSKPLKSLEVRAQGCWR